MKDKTIIIAIASIVLLILIHLPFHRSDPDYFLSIGRDAFTDEGLNTSQLRNFINHGYLSFNECDNLIKSPLFNLILFTPLKFFGTHLIVARVTIFLIVIISLLVLSSNIYFRKLLPILLITTLIQYYVFQYSHFSLSEMLSIAFIVVGIFFLFRFVIDRRSLQLFLAALVLSLAYYAKIQFAYVIALLPGALIVTHIFKISYSSVYAIAKSILWLVLFSFIYFLSWYLPHREIFDFVLKDESSQKFATVSNIPRTVAFNIIHVLFSAQDWWFNLLVVACFVMGIFLFIKSSSESFKVLFVITSLWMIIECHKLAMIYLPSRYIVSYYFAAGMMSSVVLAEAVKKEVVRVAIQRIAMVLVLLFLAGNLYYLKEIFQRRTFQVEAINNYFSVTIKNPSQPVLGVWSTNATWDCKARCIPVWRDFMNDKDVFNQFHPQAILSEPNEDESNRAFISRGIDLKAVSDSSRSFQIGKWEVIVYWMK